MVLSSRVSGAVLAYASADWWIEKYGLGISGRRAADSLEVILCVVDL